MDQQGPLLFAEADIEGGIEETDEEAIEGTTGATMPGITKFDLLTKHPRKTPESLPKQGWIE